MTVDQIALLLLAVNAAVCASVPAKIKAKAPMLWSILDAVALNVGHAANGTNKTTPYQAGIAAAVIGAVLSVVAAPRMPAELRNGPEPMLLPSASVPAVVEPAAVSPATVAEEATVATDATAVAQ